MPGLQQLQNCCSFYHILAIQPHPRDTALMGGEDSNFFGQWQKINFILPIGQKILKDNHVSENNTKVGMNCDKHV